MEIRCPNCNKLIATKQADNGTIFAYYTIMTKHDGVNISFPYGIATCGKCGTLILLNPFSENTYSNIELN